MNKEIAAQNFKEAVEILRKVQAHWWLEAGTCLGAIRENDFISHDSDIDFGVLGTKESGEILAAFLEKDYEYHLYGTSKNGMEMSFSKNGVKVDIFYFYYDIHRDVLWHSAWTETEQLFLEFTSDLFFGLKTIEFQGESVFVPNEPEQYLTERYGEDWRIPNPNWDWAKDPRCLRKRS